MGAVHDLGALVVSMRNNGVSIAETTARYINKRVRYAFFIIVFLALLIVIAIFGLVIAIIFKMYPSSVFPVWMQIPIAIALGFILYRRTGSIIFPTLMAIIIMYATIIAGSVLPFSMPDANNIPATGIWAILLLIYAFVASCLPVTTLLQPRDYMNAWQLFISMGLLVLSIIISGLFGDLHIVAPALNPSPGGAPPIMPFLFITIACGAISGFHSLVSSGTSSKQVATEKDAQFVGYGSMLLEAALSTLVIIAVGAGIGLLATDSGLIGAEAWNHHYESWSSAKGLGAKISAFVNGSANMLTFIGIPISIGKVIMGVFVASFAGTTLDTATRIQRYVVAELFSDIKIKFMSNKYTATAFAVLTAFFLAFATGADGKGALTLWPLFGSINQLLASLTLLVITLYLKEKGGKKYLTTFLPLIFMIIITLLGIMLNESVFINKSNWLLTTINGITFILALWIIIEGCRALIKKRDIQE